MMKVRCGECGKFMGVVWLKRGHMMYLTCADCIASANARLKPVSVMDIVFCDMLKHGPETVSSDEDANEQPTDAQIAAWQKEHPGESFWDGAVADSAQSTEARLQP